MKKIVLVLLTLVVGLGLFACKNDADVLVIRAWNTEFQDRFRAYYPDFVETLDNGNDLLEDGTEVKWVIVANDDGAYQTALDEALRNQSNASGNDLLDIFLIEADYARKYTDVDGDPVALDLVDDLGITTAELSDQYAYTQDIVTDSDGNLRATSWQATPGLFAYRRSIAIDVLGSDDPETVQAALSDWDKFDSVAAEMKDDGYYMLSGYDDSYRTFSNNFEGQWLESDGKTVRIDDEVINWIEQTKTYTDNGYNNGSSLWSDTWAADQGPDGNVFGFFYSTWGINFTLLGNSLADPDGDKAVGNGIYGDWGVVEGPANYYWGGTWIVGAVGTDQPELVKDIMVELTMNSEIAKNITLDTQDYTNNKTAMDAIANDPDYGSDFLGGQNHIALFNEAADGIDMSNTTPYDQSLNEGIQTAFKDYFTGLVTWTEAWVNFENDVSTDHPELLFPDSYPAEPTA
ncbi:carbohydrate ABC transporter substrate-binding protein [Mycoplasmatota bacterium]|nr:carbohydrate ABC transporter substrate-binding protein [Mycoplasmatota bacterium]